MSTDDNVVAPADRKGSILAPQKVPGVRELKALYDIDQGHPVCVSKKKDSKVYLAKSKKNPNEKVAIKVFNKEKMRQNGVRIESIYEEINLLKKLDHPNIVKYLETYSEPTEHSAYMVMEHVEG